MRLLPIVAVVAAAGCAHSVASGPAFVAMPTGGSVDVAVAGTREIAARRVGGTGFRALVVRMTLDNGGTQPWTVRPQDQVARLDRFGPLLPSDASAPALVVPPGERRVLDLYYPIPSSEYGPALPDRLALDWRVRLPQGTLAYRSNLDGQLATLRRTAL